VVVSSPSDLDRGEEVGEPSQAQLPQLRKAGTPSRLGGILSDAGAKMDAAGAAADAEAADAPPSSARASHARRRISPQMSEVALAAATPTDGVALAGGHLRPREVSATELDRLAAELLEGPSLPPVYRGPDCVHCSRAARVCRMPGCGHLMLCAACAKSLDFVLRGQKTSSARAAVAAQVSRMDCIECIDAAAAAARESPPLATG